MKVAKSENIRNELMDGASPEVKGNLIFVLNSLFTLSCYKTIKMEEVDLLQRPVSRR